MRPICLVLQNFVGILSGQGKDKIEVNLDKLAPHDAQIIALAGPNGAGKTTIMDNLHPYRIMPSRASTASTASFSFYEHIAGGEGSKDLIWENNGVRYQSVLRFRATPKTKKTEAYLFTLDEAGLATPWTDPTTGAVSDGKTDTYDRAIESILGKSEVFFQAQFSAQGKEPISAMSATDVKRLIADMIGANRSSVLSGKASDIVRAVKPRLAAIQDEILRTEQAIPSQENLDSAITQAGLSLAQCEQKITDLTEAVASVSAKLLAAGNNAAQLEAAKAQHAAYERQCSEAMAAHQAAVHQANAQSADARENAQRATETAKQGLVSSTDLVKSLHKELARLNGLVSTKDVVEAAALAAQTAKAQVAQLDAELLELMPGILRLEQVNSEVAKVAADLMGLSKDGTALAEALTRATDVAALLNDVPCQGTDLSGQCKLLKSANDASAEIPAIREKLTGARSSYKSKRAQQEGLEATLNELNANSQKAQAIRDNMTTLRTRLAEHERIAATAQAVNDAISALPDVTARLNQAVTQEQAAQAAVNAALTQLKGLDDQLAAMLAQVEATHKSRMAALAEVRWSLPAIDAGDDIQALAAQKASLDEQVQSARAAQAVCVEQLANAKARLTTAAQSRASLEQIKRQSQALSDEIAHWVLLQKALGTDGIIAMSIDDAGPAIAQIANQLLEDCYGGRFSINLVTQKDTNAGITKETFLIEVDDNERGEQKLLDLMSGGEKVWINQCLVRAIALYMAQVSDTKSQTVFSDESDGPLDPERKRQFMAMKRAVIEIGGYDREILITQTPELLGMCDFVIDVSKL